MAPWSRPPALAWMRPDLWLAPAQIRRRVREGGDSVRLALGPAVPLSVAVRDALGLLAREGVSLHLVHPPPGAHRIDEIAILHLSRRRDYPFAVGSPGANQSIRQDV